MIDLESLASPGTFERQLLDEIDLAKLPRHVAIIMDGNGRWAKQRGSPRVEGHRAGIASVREAENQHLLRQSGADSVVVSSETAGRLLGIATTTPSVVEMIEDLLTPDAGFAIAEREVEHKEVGGSPRHLPDIVLGVMRDGKLMRVDDPSVDALEATDRLLYVRTAGD